MGAEVAARADARRGGEAGAELELSWTERESSLQMPFAKSRVPSLWTGAAESAAIAYIDDRLLVLRVGDGEAVALSRGRDDALFEEEEDVRWDGKRTTFKRKNKMTSEEIWRKALPSD